ncbi:siderophore-interacting protein [Corallococcus exiguus]|uniref:siderophore-interacting protein n=1 Tax=Corallococcus TaxID=83461 RepID=UPI000F8800E2|nr:MULTISPECIES: siderophore-interacting protein [Corallococcus]NRD55035.1 siderophore-interacting protein [Corallococcus exiguus]NRD65550.1 siderophore-interacting protein [Corallococcus exiguus]RUO91426.1 siderophore-interacting protein [Corallococcus sp. AB018]
MANAKAMLGSMLGRFLFTEAKVTQVREVSRAFRQIDCEGPALRGQGWSPGDKVQVFLPGLGMRTYTPLSWDEARGATAFLVYLHGDSPGAKWGRDVRTGDTVQFFGPRRSVALESGDAPVVLFGDETSFAVAHAFRTGAKRDVTPIFEVTRREDCAPALRELGFEGQDVERTAGDAHLAQVHERLREALRTKPGATLVMTGRAQSIQALRSRLRGDGERATSKVKAYWAVGKTGLD